MACKLFFSRDLALIRKRLLTTVQGCGVSHIRVRLLSLIVDNMF